MDAVARVWWAAVGGDGHVSRRTSAWWEHAVALRERREPRVLVHAVLEVVVDDVASFVDMAPTWGRNGGSRRVVKTGPVGSRALGWCPLFRYELRVVHEAVDRAPVLRVSEDFPLPRRVLDLLSDVPAYTWGRDEARTGDMWTSNSVVAWLLEHTGVPLAGPPTGHRAPGWHAGVLVARRRSDP